MFKKNKGLIITTGVVLIVLIGAYLLHNWQIKKTERAYQEKIKTVRDSLNLAIAPIVIVDQGYDSLDYQIGVKDEQISQLEKTIDLQYLRIEKYIKRYEKAINEINNLTYITDFDKLQIELARFAAYRD